MREKMIICILYVHALKFRRIGGSLQTHALFFRDAWSVSSQCIGMVGLERLEQL